ncbi:MAG TPA: transcription termination/antitermination protein NusG [Spirochaetia bacterium]|nr:transcription termination/antitermination protein NusG [Spirochaetales bacterium]HRS64834.1 transcription termination/antitermination protein NusG [Spirochaetia bacterium]HOT58307.1 transcription termination/antitermination protein NusG [Spirochaetales bacterium]HPD79826.1 transcription termination/antitermination protein NusG [Spirochaetales bacterium]HQG40820.1 transcription termination/antitermination protein NusG [Spirochaetales bacterium]
MARAWYVLHVYSGYENKIEKAIRSMLEQGELNPAVVFDVKVPSEEVSELKNGKKSTINKKILPGYILVEMDLPDVTWKETCNAIRKINGVTGFVGSTAHKKPVPISTEEARQLLQKSGDLKGEKILRVKHAYAQGDTVKIISGPFETFTGVVEEVLPDKNKLKVTVGIFGRSTPIEVDVTQVEKV